MFKQPLLYGWLIGLLLIAAYVLFWHVGYP